MSTEVLVSPERITVRRSIARERPREAESRWFAAGRWVLLGGLFAAPLAFGAVQPWAWGGLGVMVAATLLLWAAGSLKQGWAAIPWTPVYLPLAGLWLLGLVQYLVHTTVDPIATREALVKGAIYLGVLFATSALFAGAPRRAWRQFGIAVTIYTFALALFAILQFFSSPEKIYGLVVPREGGYIFGPYVTHNGYAGLMEILVPLTTGFWVSVPRGSRWRGLAGFAALLGFCSVVVSGSRAGLVSLVVAMLLFAAIFIARSRVGQRPVTACVLVSIGGALALASLWIIPASVVARFQQATESPIDAYGMRAWMTTDTLSMARAHPFLGAGLGAFETAFPRYQSAASNFDIDFAHDDAAQMLAESGLTGGLLVLAAIAMLAVALGRRVREFDYAPRQALSLGAGVALIAIAIHGFVDFNLHLPANAAWVVCCFALAAIPPGITERIGELIRP